MSDRLKAMRRIAALQVQQKRLADWRLAMLVQQKATAEAAQHDLAGFVDGGELTGRFASEALLQSQRLARRVGQAEVQRQAQADMVQQAERRLKLSERAVERLAAEARAEAERRALETLIEAFIGHGTPDHA